MAEESEVENEVIDISGIGLDIYSNLSTYSLYIISDDDTDQATEPADDMSNTAATDVVPDISHNIIDMNDSFSASMYLGGDENPWN